MRNSPSPIGSNIYMEHLKNLALDSALHKPSLWLHCIDGTFGVWPHGLEQLQTFLSYLNRLRPTIQFTIETVRSVTPFLDALVNRKEMTLTTKVYREPTHTTRYLTFISNHLPQVKRGLVQSLLKRASTICQERQDLDYEISSPRQDLQLNGYPQGFIHSVVNSKGSSLLMKEVKHLSSVYVPPIGRVFQRSSDA
jgi:hypothetical protein